uniref:BEACH domain-containing protein n=1 Tax=Arcella intermedia TaxID=1963864 RepID=A0A6B2L4A4_9EUKA
MCYERNVDLDSVTPEEKQRIEATIAYFGQVPSQLLSYPHPERKAYLPKPVVTWETLDEENVVSLSASTYKKYKISELSQTTIIGIFVLPETTESLPGQSIQGNVGEDYRIITIDENSNFMINRYRTKEKYPFLRDTKEPGRLLLPPNTTSKIFAVSNDGKSLFAGGFWDNSIKVVEIDQRFDIASHQTIYQHKAPVTCLCLTENNHYLISGSEDTTLRIWDVIDGYRVAPTTPTNSYMLDPRGSKHVLYGHRERVLSVVASTDFDCCVSGSTGVIIIHKITNGDYIRTIKLKPEETVDLLAFQSAMGHFAVFSKSSLMIYLFSINGTLIVSKEASEQLSSLVFSRDGNLLFSGGLRGSLTIRQSHNLHTIQKISISSPIYALSIINEKSIMLGTPKTVVWIKVSKKGDKKNNYKTIKL